MSFSTNAKDFQSVPYYYGKFDELYKNPGKLRQSIRLMVDDAEKYGNIRVISEGALQWIEQNRGDLDEYKTRNLMLTLTAIKHAEEVFAGQNVARKVSSVVFSRIKDPFEYVSRAVQMLQDTFLIRTIEGDIENEDYSHIRQLVREGQLNQIAGVVKDKISQVAGLEEMRNLQKVLIEARLEGAELPRKGVLGFLRGSSNKPDVEFESTYNLAKERVIELKVAKEVAELKALKDFDNRLMHILEKLEDPVVEKEVKIALYEGFEESQEEFGAGMTQAQAALFEKIYEAAKENDIL